MQKSLAKAKRRRATNNPFGPKVTGACRLGIKKRMIIKNTSINVDLHTVPAHAPTVWTQIDYILKEMEKEKITRSTLNVGKLKHRNRNKKGPTLSKVVRTVLEEDFQFLPLSRSNSARTYSFLSDRGIYVLHVKLQQTSTGKLTRQTLKNLDLSTVKITKVMKAIEDGRLRWETKPNVILKERPFGIGKELWRDIVQIAGFVV